MLSYLPSRKTILRKLSTGWLITLLVFVSAACASDDTANRIRLIYDGDIGPDPTDFTTLSLLHEYHSRGTIDLIGVIGATPDAFLASTFSIYNQLYGHEIPIAAYSENADDVAFDDRTKTIYAAAIAALTYADQNETIYEKFGNDETQTADDVFGTVALYRKLLSESSDESVTIYLAGPLFNMPALLDSPADEYSSLGGAELVAQKVKELVFMGGDFPSSALNPVHKPTASAEYNWWALASKGLTKTTLERLAAMGKPITYIGFEVGTSVPVGTDIVERLGRAHPTSEAYYQYRPTYGGEGPDLASDNPAFDDIALYYLVEGRGSPAFEEVPGHVQINEGGANVWASEPSNQVYVELRQGSERELIGVITDRVTGQF